METLWQDLRYGVRMLAKSPGFTVIAVLTLALGIGANLGIFGFVNALFLRPLALPNADRLVRLYASESRQDRGYDSGAGGAYEGVRFGVFSYPNYADLRERNQVFSGVAAHQRVPVSFSFGDEVENVEGELVTGDYFPVMGVGAAEGRVLLPSDDLVVGAHPVAVISHRLWRQRFGGDPRAVGSTIRLNGHAFTIVGIAPGNFRGSYETLDTSFWVPLHMYEQVRPRGLPLERRGWGWLGATARLKPGVSLEQARANVETVSAQLRTESPLNERIHFAFVLYRASSLPEQYHEGVAQFLAFFLLIVGLVLLVACANVAGMLLVRLTGRQREMAVRQALGASHGRLIRQSLTEAALLSLMAAVAAVLVGLWMSDALLWLRPAGFEDFHPQMGLDVRMLGFVLLWALGATLLFGLQPALRAGRTELAGTLREESGAVGSVRRSRLQGAFVVAQVAAALVVLVAAGLLLRSLRAIEAFHPGFETRNLLLANVDLRRNGYDDARSQQYYLQAIERLRALPGVRSATAANVVPLGGGNETLGYLIPGHEPPPDQAAIPIGTNTVGPDYFATMGIPLVRGRDFEPRDAQPGAPPVAVVNETMARRFWPEGEAVGRVIQLAGGPQIEIVGVAADIKYYSLGEEPQPYLYASVAQIVPGSPMTFHVRTAGDPRELIASLRQALRALDPNVALLGAQAFDEVRAGPLFPQRALAALSSAFGLLALALTAVGLYGLMAYTVAQRNREIGIRMALGAGRPRIFQLVVGQGLLLVAVGVVLGSGGALGVAYLLESQLFGIRPTDPLTFVGVSLLLVVVGLAACSVPARRAMRVDPMVALRYE